MSALVYPYHEEKQKTVDYQQKYEKLVAAIQALKPNEAEMIELTAASDLVTKIQSTTSHGAALGHVVGFRHTTRENLLRELKKLIAE